MVRMGRIAPEACARTYACTQRDMCTQARACARMHVRKHARTCFAHVHINSCWRAEHIPGAWHFGFHVDFVGAHLGSHVLLDAIPLIGKSVSKKHLSDNQQRVRSPHSHARIHAHIFTDIPACPHLGSQKADHGIQTYCIFKTRTLHPQNFRACKQTHLGSNTRQTLCTEEKLRILTGSFMMSIDMAQQK